LARAQKQMLRIVSEEPIGFEVSTAALRHGLPRTTMQRALEALERQHFLRQDLAGAMPTWRFEDPFMRAWLATLANQ
jgi:DNA-binding IclR family transcriptional regulator